MSEQDADGWTITEPEGPTLETFPESTCSCKRTTYREGTTRTKEGEETQIWTGGKWLPV
jgi:hypothetical protein